MGKSLLSCLFALIVVLTAAQHPNMGRNMDPRSKQRAVPNSLLDLIELKAGNLFGAEKITQMKDDALRVYDLWTGNTKKRDRQARTESAAMRSGEGTPDEAFIRQKKMEQRQKLEDMEERGEYPTDIRTQK